MFDADPLIVESSDGWLAEFDVADVRPSDAIGRTVTGFVAEGPSL